MTLSRVIADRTSHQRTGRHPPRQRAVRYFGGHTRSTNLSTGRWRSASRDSALTDSEFSIDVEFLEARPRRLRVARAERGQRRVSYYGLFICQNGEFMLLKVHDGNEHVLTTGADQLIRAGGPTASRSTWRRHALRYINTELAARSRQDIAARLRAAQRPGVACASTTCASTATSSAPSRLRPDGRADHCVRAVDCRATPASPWAAKLPPYMPVGGCLAAVGQ